MNSIHANRSLARSKKSERLLCIRNSTAKNNFRLHLENVGDFYFGPKHPMKPFRVQLTNDLIVKYNLYEAMKVYRPHHATDSDMEKFHSFEYILHLKSVKADNITNDLRLFLKRFQIGTSDLDCPIFEGLYNFCQISAGGSLAAAVNLNKNESDICINWAGGLHHAKKSLASGFCYINDIVLSIVELLKYNQRILYLDIDVSISVFRLCNSSDF